MPSRTFEKPRVLELLTNWIDGNNKWINTGYMKFYIGEIEGDIKMLKEGMKECGFERAQDGMFQHLVKKYEKDFCPSRFSRFFSKENKEKYLKLRLEIDEILERKDQTYSDFLDFDNTEELFW